MLLTWATQRRGDYSAAVGASLPYGWSISRASLGTLFNSAGVLDLSPNNLEHYSQEFENAFWDKSALVSVTDNSAVAPDGTTTATLWQEGAGTGSHHIHDLSGVFTPMVGQKYCMSAYVKRPVSAPDRYVQFAFWSAGFGLTAYVNYDLVGLTTQNAAAITAAGIVDVGDGWYRIWAIAPATLAGASGWQIAFVSSLAAVRAESYTVTTGSEESLYLWGAQVEMTNTISGPGVYNPTTSSAYYGPRVTYDRATLALRGSLLEPASTNGIRNNSMQGAVAGSPGTLPTNWSVGGATGLTRTIVGVGVVNGMDYIDIRYAGTTGSTFTTLLMEAASIIAAANGQTWTGSVYLAIVGGSLTHISSINLITNILDGSAAVLAQQTQGVSLTSTLTRFSVTGTIANATAAYVRPLLDINYSSGVAVDITIRVIMPQLAQESVASSVIRTTSAAVTRALETLTISGLASNGLVDGTAYPMTVTYYDDTTAASNVTPSAGAVTLTGTQTKAIKSVAISSTPV